ncbi:MAG: biotin transporter BioY [Actinomycetes bacterium]
MSVNHLSTLRTALVPRTTLLTQTGFILGGTLFLSLMAQIAIPIPGSPVPVTGQTLAVLLLGTAYGASLGFATFAFYILMGVAGAPIFASGSHGLARFTGPTGGYLAGMLLASAITGALAGRKWDQKILTVIPTMVIGDLVIFTAGLVWLHHATSQNWSWTFSKGLTPFLLGEIIKIAIASTALPTVWRFVSPK